MSMSGKRLRVTIKLSDDKYTMKQRVRDAQILSDGFSLEDFDLVYCRTGQKLGVYGDVKEFSPLYVKHLSLCNYFYNGSHSIFG